LSIFNLVLIVLFVVALGLAGLGSANPQVMVPVCLAFFALVFWLTYVMVRRQQKQAGNPESAEKNSPLTKVFSILGWIVLLFALTFLSNGASNKALVMPLMFVFFLAIFGLTYFGVRRGGASASGEDKPVSGSARLFRTIGLILGWVIVLIALSMAGAGSKNPGVMIPVMFLFFLLVFFGVYLHTRRHSHQENANPKNALITRRIFGSLLILLSVISPLQVVRTITGTPISPAILILLGVALVVLGGVAVKLITRGYNRSAVATIPGYIMLIIVSLIPGILVGKLGESSFSAFGSAYFGALFIAVLAWWGASLFRNPEAE
jgi:preprotein translocase subunit YajC